MSAPIRHEDFDDFPLAFARRASDPAEAGRSRPAEAIGFVAGTRIATPMGYVAVERLSAGDRVLTADGRHAVLVWVGLTQMIAKGTTAPVRIDTGVMDNIRPLRLGQGHRVRVAGWQAELLFDADAVLATAKSFVNGRDVVIDESSEIVTYIHLMFDRHEVVLAENVACETLQTGPEALCQLDDMAAEALMLSHPPMPVGGSFGADRAALRILSRIEELVLRAA